MQLKIIPVSAVIATRNRAVSLAKTLDSLLPQGALPAEFIVIDASDDSATKELMAGFAVRTGNDCSVRWVAAEIAGAASQRNQGVAVATQPFIWFFDDDIVFEPECVKRLWEAVQSDSMLGGVNAMIVNQRYQPPGFVSRTLFTLLHGKREASFAGKVIGPAINLLPEDRDDLPEVVPVEWLNTTCTIYRRATLPSPPFDSAFTGYSMMEDVALSLRIGRQWRLANARTARIFHNSQPGPHKSNSRDLARMELVNRHYVMTQVLERKGFREFLRLVVWELFQLSACVTRLAWRASLWPVCQGKFDGIRQIRGRSSQRASPDPQMMPLPKVAVREANRN
jgi:glycosyltransferase involved in cell wall biosynthesis